jgi:hypothetical protein
LPPLRLELRDAPELLFPPADLDADPLAELRVADDPRDAVLPPELFDAEEPLEEDLLPPLLADDFLPAAFFDEPFLAAPFFAPPFLEADLFAPPFLAADFLDEDFLDAPFLDELRLPEDEPPLFAEPPRLFLDAPFLDAPFDEDLPPERFPDDFLDAAFLVDFAIL